MKLASVRLFVCPSVCLFVCLSLSLSTPTLFASPCPPSSFFQSVSLFPPPFLLLPVCLFVSPPHRQTHGRNNLHKKKKKILTCASDGNEFHQHWTLSVFRWKNSDQRGLNHTSVEICLHLAALHGDCFWDVYVKRQAWYNWECHSFNTEWTLPFSLATMIPPSPPLQRSPWHGPVKTQRH